MFEVGGIAVNRRAVGETLSGVQRYVLELTSRLRGLEVLEPSTPLHGVRGHLWEQFCLPQRCRRFKVLWSPANSGPLTIDRQVVTVHDLAVVDHPEWFNPQFALWYRWMMPRLVRRVRRIIAVSEFTKQRILEISGVDESRVVVIPNGVDARFRPRAQQEVNQIKRRLGIQGQEYVLNLATIEPRKNLRRQLEAWSQCVEFLPDNICLVIAGVHGKTQVFQKADLGPMPARVIMAGFIPDELLPALYSGALVFLYASIYEGFGLPALEAMACGTPPVVGQNTALSEVIGNCGVLVDAQQAESIAWGVRHLIEDGDARSALARAGLERSRGFSWQRSAELTQKILGQALTVDDSGTGELVTYTDQSFTPVGTINTEG